MTFDVRDATGADWVWLVADRDKIPSPQAVISRMVPSLDEEAAMALPAGTFRDLFHACSKSIVGDDLPD